MRRLVLLATFAGACAGQGEAVPATEPVVAPNPAPSDEVTVAELRDGVPALREGLALRDAFDADTKVVASEVVKIGAGYHLVQRSAKTTDSCRISAIALVEGPTGLRLPPRGTALYHECAGRNCTECDFETDDNGEITGCSECQAPVPDLGLPHCAHTVASDPPARLVVER